MVKTPCLQCRRYGFHCWSGSQIPHTLLHHQKQKKQINKLRVTGTSKRVHCGEDLFSIFWLHHVAYGISVPWPGIEPRPQQWNPGILTTGPPVVGGSLYLCTNPFLNSQKDMLLLLPFGVYETAFTQILVVDVYPSGVHVALSGWVVQAHLNGWSRRKVHKIMRDWAGWACDLFLYSLSPKYTYAEPPLW